MIWKVQEIKENKLDFIKITSVSERALLKEANTTPDKCVTRLPLCTALRGVPCSLSQGQRSETTAPLEPCPDHPVPCFPTPIPDIWSKAVGPFGAWESGICCIAALTWCYRQLPPAPPCWHQALSHASGLCWPLWAVLITAPPTPLSHAVPQTLLSSILGWILSHWMPDMVRFSPRHFTDTVSSSEENRTRKWNKMSEENNINLVI